jgi:hypothetical protein
MRRPSGRIGSTTGDRLVILSVLTLGAAFVYPRIAHRAFERQLDRTVAAVDAVRDAASRVRAENGDWPEGAEPGSIPAELAARLPGGFPFTTEHYTLQWTSWEITEDPPEAIPQAVASTLPEGDDAPEPDFAVPIVPRTIRAIGGLSVTARQPGLLAGLLERFGSTASFVRDSTWTLVLPERSEPRNQPSPPPNPVNE